MSRVVLGLALALAAVALFTAQPTRESHAQPAEGLASPVAECRVPGESIDVRPFHRAAAVVVPAAPAGATPTAEDGRELYVAVITIPPGGCAPFDWPGNYRDGAVVLLVQQGIVQYVWNPVSEDSAPVVMRGDSAVTDSAQVTPVPAGEWQVLLPGDWITQDRQVEIEFHNIGGDSAVIVRAAYAFPPPMGAGCGGDCK